MANLSVFDSEIEKTRQSVEEMKKKLEQSGVVLDKLAKAETIGQVDFDIENARIEDVLKQQKVMEGNIADLIIGLEDATNVFGTEFESMKSYSMWEKLVGIFSKQSMQRMRSERVRNMSLASNLQELLAKSDRIVGILKGAETGAGIALQGIRNQPQDCARAAGRRLPSRLRRRRRASRSSILMLLDLENRIAASTDQKQRAELESQRSTLATEYNKMQAREQELLAESQTLERYTSMFQTFVDSLNNQLAAQQTLINKLEIDTEQRVVLYKALEDSLEDRRPAGCRAQDQHARQQGRHRSRGDDGRHRRGGRKARSATFWNCTRRTCCRRRTSSGARSWPTTPSPAASRTCCKSTIRRTTSPPDRRRYAKRWSRKTQPRPAISPP